MKRFPARAVRGLRWTGKRRLLHLRLEFFTASDSAGSSTCFTAGNTGCIDIAVVASHVGPHRHLCFVIIQVFHLIVKRKKKKKNRPSRCSVVNVHGTQDLRFIFTNIKSRFLAHHCLLFKLDTYLPVNLPAFRASFISLSLLEFRNKVAFSGQHRSVVHINALGICLFAWFVWTYNCCAIENPHYVSATAAI